jgi:hypothetical protein
VNSNEDGARSSMQNFLIIYFNLKEYFILLESPKEAKIKFDIHLPNDKLNERLK